MLSNVSWPQYFAAVAVSGTSYYIYIALRYYRRDIAGLLPDKASDSLITNKRAVSPVNVMGPTREETHVSILNEKEVQFSGDDQANISDPEQQDQASENAVRESLQGQLVKQTDELMQAFAAIDNKDEFISLLSILADTYKQYPSEVDFSSLATFILQAAPGRLPFELFADDLSGIFM